jgi:hypothetical protein
MIGLEARIYELEKAMRSAQDAIRQLQQRVGALEQSPFASAGTNQSGGGSSSGVFFWSGAVVPGASGLPGTTSTPGVGPTGQTVFTVNGGMFVQADTNASIFNGLESPTVANQGCILLPTPGGYVIVSQSCT